MVQVAFGIGPKSQLINPHFILFSEDLHDMMQVSWFYVPGSPLNLFIGPEYGQWLVGVGPYSGSPVVSVPLDVGTSQFRNFLSPSR
jgi:hypothetical protein